jgi:hypothetical protein
LELAINNSSKGGDIVLDVFLGSGSTMIAAEKTGRSCYGIEISPAYIDVAVKRWQDFTGERATLDGDGRTFDDIAAERAPFDRDAKLASRKDAPDHAGGDAAVSIDDGSVGHGQPG